MFKINSMGDYHDLYVKIDVLLLADIFANITTSTCLGYYRWDPSHYFSNPGLSWDAILKMTGEELELISNIYGNKESSIYNIYCIKVIISLGHGSISSIWWI